ncbi:MAG: hypothetical protein EBW52_05980 [Betaproteobacteria bacterium]|nr:hypothetical protein [Betaproteobacteria bacterium]
MLFKPHAIAASLLLGFASQQVLAQETVVRLGHVAPTSGSIAHLGKDNENGARLAIEELNANNVRIQWIGRPFNEPGSKTPAFIQREIQQAIEDTAHNTGMVLTVAFDYGSRAELLRAAQHARAKHDSGIDITSHEIAYNLYAPQLPPVDVVVRTSGESRISNFLLWQIMGARVYFTERTWPDFDAHEIDNALKLVHAS